MIAKCVRRRGSSNAFKVTPGGTITQIIDLFGDGAATFSHSE
jgi:hypothetical protein